jgi:hypothetical protein
VACRPGDPTVIPLGRNEVVDAGLLVKVLQGPIVVHDEVSVLVR